MKTLCKYNAETGETQSFESLYKDVKGYFFLSDPDYIYDKFHKFISLALFALDNDNDVHTHKFEKCPVDYPATCMVEEMDGTIWMELNDGSDMNDEEFTVTEMQALATYFYNKVTGTPDPTPLDILYEEYDKASTERFYAYEPFQMEDDEDKYTDEPYIHTEEDEKNLEEAEKHLAQASIALIKGCMEKWVGDTGTVNLSELRIPEPEETSNRDKYFSKDFLRTCQGYVQKISLTNDKLTMEFDCGNVFEVVDNEWVGEQELECIADIFYEMTLLKIKSGTEVVNTEV